LVSKYLNCDKYNSYFGPLSVPLFRAVSRWYFRHKKQTTAKGNRQFYSSANFFTFD